MTDEHVWDCQLIFTNHKYTYLFKVDKHHKFKNKILKEIDKTPASNIQGVYKTDWETDSSIKRSYWEDYIKEIANRCIDILKKDLYGNINKKTWHHNHWFHVYTKDSRFDWHNHSESNFSGIYYISLPNKKYKTEFTDMDLSIEEGNLLIFPSFLLHRSPLIKDQTKKIIVSFNFSTL